MQETDKIKLFVAYLTPQLVHILRHAYLGHATAEQEKVVKLLRLWGSKALLASDLVEEMEELIQNPPSPPPAISMPYPNVHISGGAPTQYMAAAQASNVPDCLHIGPGLVATLTKVRVRVVPFVSRCGG